MKRFLLSAALLLACSGVALAQESEFSGGGGGGITAAPGSGTAGRVPQFASTTSLEDSKMTTSGTNSGTLTLYDDTATIGVSELQVRIGDEQMNGEASFAHNIFTAVDNAGVRRHGISYDDNQDALYFGLDGTMKGVFAGSYNLAGGAGRFDGGTGLVLHPSFLVTWSDIALARSAEGILKVTDGSTGQGGIGLSDAATNTVSDALILRHATSGTAAASFGTGLLFQGENAAGTMHDMASIDAVYTDATNGSEDADVVLRGFKAGAELEFMRFREGYMGTVASISINSIGGSIDLRSADNLYISPAGLAAGWVVNDPALAPYYTNTYDIGTSSLLVRNNYVSTSIQGTRTKTLTDNAAATTFVTIAVPTSDTTVGGRIFYTITAIDAGTAIQTKTGTYSFGLNNIGGTVTGNGTDVLEHSQLSAGTLAPTFSVNISGTNAQFQLVLDTSLDAGAETLKIEYRVQIDSGTATVTPAT